MNQTAYKCFFENCFSLQRIKLKEVTKLFKLFRVGCIE